MADSTSSPNIYPAVDSKKGTINYLKAYRKVLMPNSMDNSYNKDRLPFLTPQP